MKTIYLEEITQSITVVFYTHKARATVLLKGTGVRPEVSIDPEDRLINLSSVLVGESTEKNFTIKNLSSFAVVYQIKVEAQGLQNKDKQPIFEYTPSTATIEPGESQSVTAKFSPGFQGESFYEKILVDIPNQINPKSLFLRGFAWNRQISARIYQPFVWPLEEFFQKTKPMDLMVKEKDNTTVGFRKTLVLQFTKIVEGASTSEEEKEKETIRKIVIASSQLVGVKQDKPGTFEISLQKDDYFSCDLLKGNIAPGAEQIVKFVYSPPKKDQALANIKAIQNIGQWVQTKCELKLMGGFLGGGADSLTYDIVLRAYAEQI